MNLIKSTIRNIIIYTLKDLKWDKHNSKIFHINYLVMNSNKSIMNYLVRKSLFSYKKTS